MPQPAVSTPAELWDHDRRLIASWLLREVGGHFDKAETRADGSSFIQFPTTLGAVSVHDYWSFARYDFQLANRNQSYQEALQRQVPILSFGYDRPAVGPSQLVVFLNGELTIAQGAQTFAPFMAGKPSGALVAVETQAQTGHAAEAALYTDPFLALMLQAVRLQTQKPPAS
ncbi:MAG TPA: hypothetical protein VHQ86_02945 [Candidatus Saccharimonadia bacterium]|jgi:hypothetical protein|nr:hypothetical protein [Candidatus Saccharimonadia bacterium]